MIELKHARFPRRLAAGEVRFTVNLRTADLQYLIDEADGPRYFCRDEDVLDGEDAQQNVLRVWCAIGEDTPNEFVSIAVRSVADTANVDATLLSYGNVVLEILPTVIAADAVVFNGDVKNLGRKVAEANDDGWVIRIPFDGDAAALEDHLRDLARKARSIAGERPRLVGSYFEARLRRALVPDDIAAVWVDPADERALRAARLLCGVV